MPTDVGKWKVTELTDYLSQRCISKSSGCRKDVLIKLCRIVEDYRLQPEPSASQRQAEKDARWKEILTVSKRLGPPGPESTSLSWSASFADYPDINLMHLYAYFIRSPSPAYQLENLKAYKSLGAYQNAQDGFVERIFVSTSLPSKWVFVKGSVFASQTASKTYDEVWILMSREGNIRDVPQDWARRVLTSRLYYFIY